MYLINEFKAKIRVEELLYGMKDELNEFRTKQKGGVTPANLMVVLLNDLLSGQVEEIVVARKYKNGTVDAGWTPSNGLEGMGMAEFLKQTIYEDMEED